MLLFPSLPTSPFKFSPKKCKFTPTLQILFFFLIKILFQNYYRNLFQKRTAGFMLFPSKNQQLLWSKEVFASLHMKTRVSHLHIPTIYLPFDIMEDNLLIISCKGEKQTFDNSCKVLPVHIIV